jgi:hypothetical protein
MILRDFRHANRNAQKHYAAAYVSRKAGNREAETHGRSRDDWSAFDWHTRGQGGGEL